MKQVFVYIAFCSCLLLWVLSGYAQKSPGILVQVLDQKGHPIAGEAISIHNSDYYLTDAKGEFSLEQQQLRVPVRASFRNEKLEVLSTAYFEDEARLQVNARRYYNPDEVIQLVLKLKGATLSEKLSVRFRGRKYTSSTSGKVDLPEAVTYLAGAIEVSGYEVISENLDSRDHHLTVILSPLQESELTASDTVMLSYEADFERIAREIERERLIFEEKNKEIEAEILKIRDNLVLEEDINDEQRNELKRYLGNMEKVLRENAEAIRQSEERTKEAIAKLRLIIIEKDSINLIAQGKIVQMEAEQAAAEEGYRQKIAIYSSIIIVLVLLAILIYFFAARMRRQRQWFKEVNKRLKVMQGELTGSLQELNLRKAQIEDHNNQLELFVYKASHDIKGPLRSIIGLTQIGMADVKDAVAQEYFGHINKSTQRLDNLLADLLRLTKAKQAEVSKQDINLPEMVDNIIQSFKNIRYFDKVKIEVNIQEGIEFQSDEKMLYSVIQNFIENGIKYCDSRKEEPFLHISIRQEAGIITMEFCDNGLGIEEEHLPKIFDMFYKVDHNSDGTGLGLHIVKVTLEKLGGTLKVRSGKGTGSVFTITFYDTAVEA